MKPLRDLSVQLQVAWTSYWPSTFAYNAHAHVLYKRVTRVDRRPFDFWPCPSQHFSFNDSTLTATEALLFRRLYSCSDWSSS